MQDLKTKAEAQREQSAIVVSKQVSVTTEAAGQKHPGDHF